MPGSEISSQDFKKFYEGDDYTGRYHNTAGPRIQTILSFIKFKPGDRVLDIGCGNGLLLPEIVGKISQYDGVDFSKTFIKQARDLAQKLHIPRTKYSYVAGDVIKFCASHKNYDKVFAFDFTEHINNEEFIKIFSAVKQSLKPSGELVIHTPNRDYFIERFKSENRRINIQGHIGLRNGQQYKKLLESLGYKQIKIIPIRHYVKGLRSLHFLGKLPTQTASSFFQARLVIKCKAK